MPQDYEVQDGDCMSSIAYSHGFFWKTLWNLGENAALKAKRKNPNVLMTGDIVHIPDLTVKQEPGATDQRHKFVLNGVPEKLRMKLLDQYQKPRPNLDYIIVIDGKSRRGKTDGDGKLSESIPPNAKEGKLIYPSPVGDPGDPADGSQPPGQPASTLPIPGSPNTTVVKLKLGNLNPMSTVSGFKSRLANLGFYKGPIDDQLDDATKKAISAFQTKQNLPVTGDADDATKAKLNSLHGH